MAKNWQDAGSRYRWLLAVGLMLGLSSKAEPLYPADSADAVAYRVAEAPWSERLGGHRAVLDIASAADAVLVRIPWRRRDDPSTKQILVMDSTGKQVPHLFRASVSSEQAILVMGPVTTPGRHEVYYLPFQVQLRWGGYGRDYLPPEPAPDPEWATRHHLTAGLDPAAPADLLTATLVEFQSRTAFDSFFPMEVPATEAEHTAFLAAHPDAWLLFPEDRQFPIRMFDHLPTRWLSGPPAEFSGEALRNEFYVFQMGVFAAREALDGVEVGFSELAGPSGVLPATAWTCFNTGGTDCFGNPFQKAVQVGKGRVQPLWIGIDVGKETPPGTYRGTVTVRTGQGGSKTMAVTLRVTEDVLEDRGDSELWRHSRLRWLNSTLGIADTPIPPYPPITRDGAVITCLGRTLEIGDGGWPRQVTCGSTPLLSSGITVALEMEGGPVEVHYDPVAFTHESPGSLRWYGNGHGDSVDVSTDTIMEFDGHLLCSFTVTARQATSLTDVRLEIPIRTEVGTHFMGAGRPGGATPPSYDWQWEGLRQDSLWIGNAQAGLHVELRGSTYHGPLLNRIQPPPPPAWHNQGKGAVRVRTTNDTTLVIAHSGARGLSAGESARFEFALLVTPVKPVATAAQFRDRYYHNAAKPEPSEAEREVGVKVVNVHHGNSVNPYINFPFLEPEALRAFIDTQHRRGLKVKLYYTLRELTNHLPEIWALRSLGHEVLEGGRGGGYPWLREHFISDYTPRWYHHFDDRAEGGADAAIANSGASRWYNYYVESLAWLTRNADIDGLYLDDVSYDRRILKRVRRAMAEVKPGILIDLHSNTAFSHGPAVQYAEFFPYVDKLWFGESFQYDQMSPESWLVEVSGIPFGLMGDMLHGGGNRYLGMVYGMTTRLPWTSESQVADPRPIWNLWDHFGIQEAEMLGYWDPACPVRTGRPDIRATVYYKPGQALIALASWAPEPASVTLQIDWASLGLDPTTARLVAPAVDNFQPQQEWGPSDPISVKPLQGWLIMIGAPAQALSPARGS